MSFQVRGLRVGDVVTGKFHGSRSLGNDSYTLDNLEVVEVGDDAVTFAEGSLKFDIYKFQGRWSYGSSAERFSVLDKVSTS